MWENRTHGSRWWREETRTSRASTAARSERLSPTLPQTMILDRFRQPGVSQPGEKHDLVGPSSASRTWLADDHDRAAWTAQPAALPGSATSNCPMTVVPSCAYTGMKRPAVLASSWATAALGEAGAGGFSWLE